MSTLQQSVSARLAATAQELASVGIANVGPAVTIWTWGSDCWVLPWSHLLAGNLTEHQDQELLTLSFSGHEVKALGYNLRSVLEALAGFRISFLREFPSNYQSRFAAEAPFILSIRVKADGPASGKSWPDSEKLAPRSVP